MTFLGIRQKVVGSSDEIPTNFFFPTKRYRRTGSSEIRRNRSIPTNFRRFRPSESPCFLVVKERISTPPFLCPIAKCHVALRGVISVNADLIAKYRSPVIPIIFQVYRLHQLNRAGSISDSNVVNG
ncbi:hypothetical protein F2Q68_00004105 [Brassica cretica]|uniref:Uncharacterized protein n=1 Tax=Brassica cretica TaxID=69181 RepID=A0A8S9JCR4_BRACR|nr:hypothetical protein F2Q68_00004105 [Brassica cretica]